MFNGNLFYITTSDDFFNYLKIFLHCIDHNENLFEGNFDSLIQITKNLVRKVQEGFRKVMSNHISSHCILHTSSRIGYYPIHIRSMLLWCPMLCSIYFWFGELTLVYHHLNWCMIFAKCYILIAVGGGKECAHELAQVVLQVQSLILLKMGNQVEVPWEHCCWSSLHIDWWRILVAYLV